MEEQRIHQREAEERMERMDGWMNEYWIDEKRRQNREIQKREETQMSQNEGIEKKQKQKRRRDDEGTIYSSMDDHKREINEWIMDE